MALDLQLLVEKKKSPGITQWSDCHLSLATNERSQPQVQNYGYQCHKLFPYQNFPYVT
jgi:hypothetical protein